MSRIDEALQRLRGGADAPASAVPSQAAFNPAWTSDDLPRTRVPSVEPRRFDRRPATNSSALLSLSSAWRERLATGVNADTGLVEAFRQLAGTLHHLQRTNRVRSVMLTSAAPGDGKTIAAVNLALVLSESYRAQVLLIDADLRRPSIPSVVPLGDGVGLSEALRADTEQRLALVQLTPTLTLLPAGQPIPNSIEALTSPRMRHILEEAVDRFDWVILDAPPIGPATDPRLLTDMVDGTLFVVRAGKTQAAEIQKGVAALGRSNILGVVLNGVAAKPMVAYFA